MTRRPSHPTVPATFPARSRRQRARRRALAASCRLALALVLVAPLACGPAPAADAGDQEPAAAEEAPRPAEPAAPEPAPTPEDPIAGTWWVLSRELPIRAFRMNLVPASGVDEPREGHWVSFDWQATSQEERLVRRSKPVAIRTHDEGDVLVVEGPSPMLTDAGEPNGRSGMWRLELRRSNMPGEPLRLAGKAVHTELTGPEGVAVELSRAFRTWSRN